MKLTEDEVVYQLMEITMDAKGLSSLEANLYNSDLLKQILENQEFKEQYEHYVDRELLKSWFDTVTMSSDAFKRMKEKAEKHDTLIEIINMWVEQNIIQVDTINGKPIYSLKDDTVLEKENKRLKETDSVGKIKRIDW